MLKQVRSPHAGSQFTDPTLSEATTALLPCDTAVLITTINVMIDRVSGQIQLVVQAAQQSVTAALPSFELQSSGGADGNAAAQQAGLSPREIEVLQGVAQGLTYRQIADRLTISTRTVDHHLESIYGKLGVSSRHAASLWAHQHRLV